MQWKKPSPELIELLVSTMGPFEADQKKMFGSTVYFSNDQMFIGVHEDHIFLRLPEPDRNALKLAFAETSQFEPMKGRPMREYVLIPPRLYEDTASFKPWIAQSMKYVKSLPQKAAKVKK